MSEKITVPGLSESENGTFNRLKEQLEAKAPRNLLRSSYYDGKRAVKSIGTIIPPQYATIGLALGWAAKGVDGLARRCNLDKMVWADGDIDSLGMNELADANFLYSEISQAETDSFLHGVSYLITTQGDENVVPVVTITFREVEEEEISDEDSTETVQVFGKRLR